MRPLGLNTTAPSGGAGRVLRTRSRRRLSGCCRLPCLNHGFCHTIQREAGPIGRWRWRCAHNNHPLADLGRATAPLDFAWCLVIQTIPTVCLWTKDAGTSHYSPATRSSVHATVLPVRRRRLPCRPQHLYAGDRSCNTRGRWCVPG
jgi:hypothetical protein